MSDGADGWRTERSPYTHTHQQARSRNRGQQVSIHPRTLRRHTIIIHGVRVIWETLIIHQSLAVDAIHDLHPSTHHSKLIASTHLDPLHLLPATDLADPIGPPLQAAGSALLVLNITHLMRHIGRCICM